VPADSREYPKHTDVTVLGNEKGLAAAGREFTGWSANAESDTAAYTAGAQIEDITADVNLYAVFSGDEARHTVTYDLNLPSGAEKKSGNVPAATSHLRHTTATLATPAADLTVLGYDFGGWTRKPGPTAAVTEIANITADETVYAIWNGVPILPGEPGEPSDPGEPGGPSGPSDPGDPSNPDAPFMYTVTYHKGDADGGTVPAAVEYRKHEDVPVSRNTGGLFKYERDMAGWSTSVNGSAAYLANGESRIMDISANYELYPAWEAARNAFYITYDAKSLDGGKVTPEHPTTFTADDLPVSIPAANRNGYNFVGWYLDAELSTQLGTDGNLWQITMTGDKVLYAKWRVIPNSGDPDDDTVGAGNDETPLVSFEGAHIPYIFGYADGTVRPDRNITRAEVAMIFFRLLADDEKTVSRVSNFPDVRSDVWYAQAVAYLESLGVLLGYPDGTFKPDRSISRAEFAAISARFSALDGTTENAFSDVSSTHWALSYINSAATHGGWVQGFPDGTFRPDEWITRAQVVTVINRMLQRILHTEDIPEGIATFTDLPRAHWAYADIVEASTDHDRYNVAVRPDGSEIWTAKAAATSEEAQPAA
jgi:uncharacterized repeat protein (TIGR02543 family)